MNSERTTIQSNMMQQNKDYIIDGWDWSFPEKVKPSQYSGLVSNDGQKRDIMNADVYKTLQGNKIYGLWWSWKLLEPEEGVYDFEALRNTIKQVCKEYDGVMLHIASSVYDMKDLTGKMTREHIDATVSAPAWLVDKLNIPLIEEKPLVWCDTPFQIINIDICDQRVHHRYIKIVKELGKSKIPQMEEVFISYVHSPSPSRGEEGNLPFEGRKGEVGRERLEALAEAYKGVEYKLAYTGAKGEMLDYAYKLGMGQRSGFVEQYLVHSNNPQLGQSVDKDGYLVVDETLPVIKENRAFGDENEEYGKQWEPRFGPYDTFPHRYRESMLRVLQMRRNFVWIDPEMTIDPDLLSYVGLELGRNVYNTPDVWCYLRESYINVNDDFIPLKNFERWLYQRDGQASGTKPVNRVEHGHKTFNIREYQELPDNLRVDYTARSTDVASGNNKIGFNVDNRFLSGGPHDIVIKVTYHDVGNGSWNLIYQTAEGQESRNVKCTDSNQIRTATFYIHGACFNVSKMDYDFEICCCEGDIAVSFVRVIRQEGLIYGKCSNSDVR